MSGGSGGVYGAGFSHKLLEHIVTGGGVKGGSWGVSGGWSCDQRPCVKGRKAGVNAVPGDRPRDDPGVAHGSAGVSPEGWLPDRVSVGALTRAFPPDLVDRVVDTTDTREVRRLLPA